MLHVSSSHPNCWGIKKISDDEIPSAIFLVSTFRPVEPDFQDFLWILTILVSPKNLYENFQELSEKGILKIQA